MKKLSFSRATIITVVVLCALLGISIWFGKAAASTEHFHRKNLAYLETKRENAKALSGAASASSVLISMLPDDTATPFANQIANISTQFLIILSALTAEQDLLMITGEIAFCWLIPFAIVFLILFVLVQRKLFLQLGVKLLICGLSVFLVVPLSLQITRMADTSYQEMVDDTLAQSQAFEEAMNGKPLTGAKTSDSQSEALTEDTLSGESAMTIAETESSGLSDLTTEADTQPLTEKSKKKESKEKKTWYETTCDTITNAAHSVQDTAQSAVTGMSELADDATALAKDTAEQIKDTAIKVADGVGNAADSTVDFVLGIPDLPQKAAALLDSFTEAFVLMMVTTCVLPIFVLLGCVWIMNMLLSIDPDWDGAKLYRSARKSSSHKKS